MRLRPPFGWRAAWCSVAALALVAACSSDPATTAEPEPDATTETAAPGAITPTVLCVEGIDTVGVAYFGYTNDGDVPVAIPVGPDNQIVAADGETELTTGQTGVFSPGEQQLVGWAVLDGQGGTATWSITGPDGETRTAVADLASSPQCPESGAVADPPDERTAELVGAAEVASTAPDGSLELVFATVSLEGLPESSPCPAGDHPWVADPTEVTLVDYGVTNGSVVEQADRSKIVVAVADPNAPTGDFGEIEGFVRVNVAVDVEDHCHDANGAVSTAWGASVDLIALSQTDRSVCFGVIDERGQRGYGVVDCTLGGPGLGETGGARLR